MLGAIGSSFGGGYGEHDRSRVGRGFEDLAIVTEATLAAMLLTDLIKLGSARRRPDAHLGLDAGRDRSKRNESFVSGHTSAAAALAASASTVAYLRGYPFRAGVLIGGSVLALTVGVLRVISVRHWSSDVLAGWLLGATVGVLMPLILHDRRGSDGSGDPAWTSAPLLRTEF